MTAFDLKNIVRRALSVSFIVFIVLYAVFKYMLKPIWFESTTFLVEPLMPMVIWFTEMTPWASLIVFLLLLIPPVVLAYWKLEYSFSAFSFVVLSIIFVETVIVYPKELAEFKPTQINEALLFYLCGWLMIFLANVPVQWKERFLISLVLMFLSFWLFSQSLVSLFGIH